MVVVEDFLAVEDGEEDLGVESPELEALNELQEAIGRVMEERTREKMKHLKKADMT